jgi:calcineurin-like phosphoesterase family protein
MSKKFVTADHHFFHESIIRHCQRPFPDVPTMNREMVERWNSVVAPNDIVYYGGDMFYKGRTKECGEILDQLNGQIYFVRGNHDKTASKFKHRFKFWGDMLEIKHDGHLIVLAHYAMRVWNKSFHGSFHVYGHSHGQLPEDPGSLSFDIGVDCWDFYPVPIERVLEKMATKEANRVVQG